jgi:UPF0755 protein
MTVGDEMKKAFLVLILLILIAGIGGFFMLPGYFTRAYNAEIEEIKVEAGDTLSSVAEDLYAEGIIKSRLWFKYNGKDIATKIKPGTYTLDPGSSISDIYDLIQQGEKEVPIIITFPEGFILYQFAQKIEESGLSTADDFIAETEEIFMESYSEQVDSNMLYYKLEGYLFPDTYHFSVKQSLEEIVRTLTGTMDKVWTEELEAKRTKLDLTKHQVLTIASLIEREAYNDEERDTISGVIFNRIAKGMPLQIDATVIYGIGEGKEHMTRVLYSDLEKDNPFNTYRNKGLPPGPIASPGINSVIAALNPEEHDFLYYVMGEDGHVFAKTYNEHLRNVEKYRSIQK